MTIHPLIPGEILGIKSGTEQKESCGIEFTAERGEAKNNQGRAPPGGGGEGPGRKVKQAKADTAQ